MLDDNNKDTKEKMLKGLIGDYIAVILKQATPMDIDPETGEIVSGNALVGYVVDVAGGFLLLGQNAEEYDLMLDLEDIGIIKLIGDENITEFLKMPNIDEGEIH